MKKLCYVFILLFLLNAKLYNDDEFWLKQLSDSNFYEFGNKTIQLIQFYSSGCPHCIRYSPVYKSISFKNRHWNRYIRMSVMDCFETENIKYCNVDFVPQVKCSMKGKEPIIYEKYPKTERELSLLLADCLSKSEEDVKVIFNEAKTPDFIIEGPETKELLNVLVNLRANIFESVNARISTAQEYKVLDNKNRLLFSGSINQTFEYFRPKMTKTDQADEFLLNQENSIKVKKHDDFVYAEDVESSLINLFRNDVGMSPEISDVGMKALRNFIDLLIKYLKLSSEFLEPLKKLKTFADSKETLTGQAWLEKLNEVSFPERKPRYIACQGSKTNLRGYPCGLWFIFHSLTVGEHLKNKDNPTKVPETVFVLNRFIPIFFSCRECGINFAIETRSLAPSEDEVFPEGADVSRLEFANLKKNETDVPRPKTTKEAVLFLNTVHNKVNVRLSGDFTDDPMFRKSIFPKPYQCSKCYSGDALKKFQANWKEAAPDRNDLVAEYLIKFYDPAHRKRYTGSDFTDIESKMD